MKYGNKKNWKRFLFSPLAAIVVLVVFVVMARATYKIHARAEASRLKLIEQQTEYSRLQAKRTDLASKVGYLSTEQGQESEIRSKFRAVKDGESLAVIVDDGTIDNSSSTNIAAASKAVLVEKSWWQKILGVVGL